MSAKRKRSEKSMYAKVFRMTPPGNDQGAFAKMQHDRAHAVVKAFDAVGRIVRVVPSEYGDGIVFTARKGR